MRDEKDFFFLTLSMTVKWSISSFVALMKCNHPVALWHQSNNLEDRITVPDARKHLETLCDHKYFSFMEAGLL